MSQRHATSIVKRAGKFRRLQSYVVKGLGHLFLSQKEREWSILETIHTMWTKLGCRLHLHLVDNLTLQFYLECVT